MIGDLLNKQLRIAVFTTVEVVALVVWLVLALSATDILISILAIAVLIGGFTLEHLITYNVIHKRPLFDFRGLPVAQKAVVSLIETGIWVVWLVIARLDVFGGFEYVIAAVVLTGLLIIEHTLSDNVFTGKRLFERIADRRTIGFSIIEGVGATIWLVLVDIDLAIAGIIVLAVVSFIEHNLAINFSTRVSAATSWKSRK